MKSRRFFEMRISATRLCPKPYLISPWIEVIRTLVIGDLLSVALCRRWRSAVFVFGSIDTTCHACHTVSVSHKAWNCQWPTLVEYASYSHRVVRFQVIQVSRIFRIFYIPELVDQQGTPSHWPVQEFHLHHWAQWRGQV